MQPAMHNHEHKHEALTVEHLNQIMRHALPCDLIYVHLNGDSGDLLVLLMPRDYGYSGSPDVFYSLTLGGERSPFRVGGNAEIAAAAATS